MTDKLCYIIAEGLDSMGKYSKELYSKDVLMKAGKVLFLIAETNSGNDCSKSFIIHNGSSE